MDGHGFEKAELDALERVVGDATAEPMRLTMPLLRHITNGFSYKSEIGSGGFAVVYLALCRVPTRKVLGKQAKLDKQVLCHTRQKGAFAEQKGAFAECHTL